MSVNGGKRKREDGPKDNIIHLEDDAATAVTTDRIQYPHSHHPLPDEKNTEDSKSSTKKKPKWWSATFSIPHDATLTEITSRASSSSANADANVSVTGTLSEGHARGQKERVFRIVTSHGPPIHRLTQRRIHHITNSHDVDVSISTCVEAKSIAEPPQLFLNPWKLLGAVRKTLMLPLAPASTPPPLALPRGAQPYSSIMIPGKDVIPRRWSVMGPLPHQRIAERNKRDETLTIERCAIRWHQWYLKHDTDCKDCAQRDYSSMPLPTIYDSFPLLAMVLRIPQQFTHLPTAEINRSLQFSSSTLLPSDDACSIVWPWNVLHGPLTVPTFRNGCVTKEWPCGCDRL